MCLCRDCSARYRAIRDANKDEFKKQIKGAILTIDTSEEADDYSIMFDSETGLHFTQTHIAEIQEILRLLSEYGTPSDDADELYDSSVSGPLLHPTTEKVEIKRPSAVPDNISKDMQKSESIGETEGKVVTEKEIVTEDASDVAKAGCFITYKKHNSDEIKDNTLQPGRFPLHKAFLGHRPGDVVRFMGAEYEIIGVIND